MALLIESMRESKSEKSTKWNLDDWMKWHDMKCSRQFQCRLEKVTGLKSFNWILENIHFFFILTFLFGCNLVCRFTYAHLTIWFGNTDVRLDQASTSLWLTQYLFFCAMQQSRNIKNDFLSEFSEFFFGEIPHAIGRWQLPILSVSSIN